jgi:hypothetical protein
VAGTSRDIDHAHERVGRCRARGGQQRRGGSREGEEDRENEAAHIRLRNAYHQMPASLAPWRLLSTVVLGRCYHAPVRHRLASLAVVLGGGVWFVRRRRSRQAEA